MKSWHQILSWIVIGLAGALICLVVYLKTWPLTPVKYHLNPIPIVGSKVFKPGDVVPLHFKFTRYTNTPCIGHRRLIDETITPLSSIMGRARTKGTFDFISQSNWIPRHVQPSVYYFEFTFEYRMNFLRTEYVRVVSEPFEVVR